MCIVSNVYDHYGQRFPVWPQPPQPVPYVPQPEEISDVARKVTEILRGSTTTTTSDIAELRKLIAEFREAVEMAKKLDALLKQPDCTDPTKAALEERVRRIEEVIGRMETKP